jgi:hypothetical protein
MPRSDTSACQCGASAAQLAACPSSCTLICRTPDMSSACRTRCARLVTLVPLNGTSTLSCCATLHATTIWASCLLAGDVVWGRLQPPGMASPPPATSTNWSTTDAAVLCCAVLCCAVLCCAVLCCAVLCCAVLCCAVLCTSGVMPFQPPQTTMSTWGAWLMLKTYLK